MHEHLPRCCGGNNRPLTACAGRGGDCPGAARGHPSSFGLPPPQRARLAAKGRKGKLLSGSIQRHPNSVPLSRTLRSHPLAPLGSGFPGETLVSRLGKRGGTAPSCPTEGLRLEKAIFRGGSSGETHHWLSTYARTSPLVRFKGNWEDPCPLPGIQGDESVCIPSLPTLCAYRPLTSVHPP